MKLNEVVCSDAVEYMRSLPDACVDCVVTDPPYAEVDRDYGRLSENEWTRLMHDITLECKRVLKPTGSAVFVLQSNMERIGKMRLWLWRYLVWCGENWNVIQDAYWWNYTTIPANVQTGLMRSSVKTLVWVGEPDCYRNQEAVLWQANLNAFANKKEHNWRKSFPSGASINPTRTYETVLRRGGSTPFNLLPIANTNSVSSAGANGHGAGTPYELVHWWIRYLCPPKGIVLEPFAGSGTTCLAARDLGCQFLACEKEQKYVDIARQRLSKPFTESMF